MKKIKLALFVALICFISCGERYKEPKGPVFEGTWTLIESYVDTVKVAVNRGKFLVARDFEGEKLLLFYTGGRYDSSFFYRVQDNNLFVRKVMDSVEIIEYYMLDSNGDTIKNGSGYAVYRAIKDYTNSQWLTNEPKNIRIIGTVVEAQKPLHPHTNYSPEKYYGTYSFNEGAQLTVTINRYQADKTTGAPTTILYGREIYMRPVEIE
jgi:hypothetical protein